MRILMVAFCTLLVIGVTGCQNMRGRDIGTVAGATTGAVAGAAIGGSGTSAVVGAGIGAVGGGVAGHYIGKSMEKKN